MASPASEWTQIKERNDTAARPGGATGDYFIGSTRSTLEFTVPYEATFGVCDRLIKLYEQLYSSGLPYTLFEVRFTPAGHDRTLIGASRDRRSTWIDIVCNDSDGFQAYYVPRYSSSRN
jgi:hypothetical protein